MAFHPMYFEYKNVYIVFELNTAQIFYIYASWCVECVVDLISFVWHCGSYLVKEKCLYISLFYFRIFLKCQKCCAVVQMWRHGHTWFVHKVSRLEL
jgi:hypothetical protein